MRVSDAPAEIAVHERATLYGGFRAYERILFEQAFAGETHRVRREILRVGKVAAVLPYDPDRDEIILFRQFRIGAHEATGIGDLVEIVAGLAEPGESLEATARRETMEEIGLEPLDLVPIFEVCPTPGFSDEHAAAYCARVDATVLPEVAGVHGEHESTRPFAIPAEAAIALARAPAGLRNGYTLLALFWFALHRNELRERWAAAR